MKRNLLTLACIVALACACSSEIPIGKSLSRWNGFGVESMIEHHKNGIEYIEVTMKNVIGKDTAGVRERAAHLKAQIDSAGFKVWSVHMPYSRQWDISAIDSAKRTDAVRLMQDIVYVAGIFQPKNVVMHPSSGEISPEEREEKLNNSRESISLIAPCVKEIGATLCVENLPRTGLGQNGQEMMFLIKGIDNVAICFDVNHLLYQSHEDFLKEIESNTIKTVHLSDYDFVDERHLLPGAGQIDWQPLWKGIRQNGYDGIMMFECYGEPEELKHARNLITGTIPS